MDSAVEIALKKMTQEIQSGVSPRDSLSSASQRLNESQRIQLQNSAHYRWIEIPTTGPKINPFRKRKPRWG